MTTATEIVFMVVKKVTGVIHAVTNARMGVIAQTAMDCLAIV